MKKITTFLLLALLGNCIVNARPVSQANALTVAQNFYVLTTGHAVNNASVAYTGYANSQVAYYVFNINVGQDNEKGFVIVSAEDALYPILGYGNQNNTYTVPTNQGGGANVLFWMNAKKHEITQVRSLNITAAPDVAAQWAHYLNPGATSPAGGVGRTMHTNSIFPSSSDFLVQSQWGQSGPYNNLCPGAAVTGCVATAQAQIMRYWNWPSYGVGASCDSISDYAHRLICDSYGRNYEWSKMELVYPPIRDTAIARLMYDVGISVGMEYSTEGSDAMVIDSDAIDSVLWRHLDTASAQNSLVKYFRYNKATIKGLYAADYSANTWNAMLKNELDSNRPINYAGYNSDTLDGHSWICDGYDASANTNFHFNFGWNGSDDGWYPLNNLSPTYSGITFTTFMEGLMGIQPDTTISFTSVPSIQPVLNNISVYPNPSNGTFTFQTKNEKLTTKNVVEVYNMLGERIYSQFNPECSGQHSTFSIDLSNRAAGVYMYRITNADGTVLKADKLVIEK